ncbi:MAG: SPOR domain-containing protein [Dysgonamonadaceae bacterium]|jgi:hypothetical protein|nr:SPOR domain-containing protein [Dysgonamonadaceae bacterium]MDD3356738.1 SPOR domain-containing protein [Dysgonamonadaceae bacterium]MDD4245648.1 SPOR domain-containing protein [Dysgonamonadaceae bacterium]
MDEIALHIDFLLHTHDCIIVPGLGGFVVNTTDIERNGLWGINSPTCELIFNSKLTYNDGLLAESLMKTNDISFDIAIKRIDSACNELKDTLQKQEEVIWNNLGTFRLNNEKEPFFLPNKSYIRPNFFGLTHARLKPLSILSTKANNNENAIPVKTFLRYISSAIAVALLFFFIAVSYNNFGPKSQQAEIVSKTLIFNKSKSVSETTKANGLTETHNPIANRVVSKTESANSLTSTNTETTLNQSKSSINYYIVVGVYEVRDVAEKMLNDLKNQGFNTASILKRPGRLDVYSASFTDKREAQSFLKKFHADYPKYYDAWLLKR